MMGKYTEELFEAIKLSIKHNNSNEYIGLHEPYFQGTNALSYIKDCIDSGWVSSAGEWISRLEKKICEFTGAEYAIAVTNGSVGLRLALHSIGVKPLDEVIIPPLTFVATANAVSHLGAIPHFVDINKENLGMCHRSLQRRLESIAKKKSGFVINKKTGRRITAIMPVHIFGIPADIIEIKKVADHWGLPIVEDAAEALGSRHFKNGEYTHCGLNGEIGVFSFNGNKIITTGGGGILITNNKQVAEKSRYLSTTAKASHPWEFNHTEIGWNDRMPNINAALGVSQLESINEKLELKKNLFQTYKKNLLNIEGIEIIEDQTKNIKNNWLINLRFLDKKRENALLKRESLLRKAHSEKILLRPVWKLLHTLEMYKDSPRSKLKVAEDQEARLISLPSSPQLTLMKNQN